MVNLKGAILPKLSKVVGWSELAPSQVGGCLAPAPCERPVKQRIFHGTVHKKYCCYTSDYASYTQISPRT